MTTRSSEKTAKLAALLRAEERAYMRERSSLKANKIKLWQSFAVIAKLENMKCLYMCVRVCVFEQFI